MAFPRNSTGPFAQITSRGVLVFVALYLVVSIGMLLSTNPFSDSVKQASRLSGFDEQCMNFMQGSYGVRFFYLKSEAEVWAYTENGHVPIQIEMTRFPLTGWMVNRYEVLAEVPF